MGLVIFCCLIGGPLLIGCGFYWPWKIYTFLKRKYQQNNGSYYAISFLAMLGFMIMVLTGALLLYELLRPLISGCLGGGCSTAQYDTLAGMSELFPLYMLIITIAYCLVSIIRIIYVDKNNIIPSAPITQPIDNGVKKPLRQRATARTKDGIIILVMIAVWFIVPVIINAFSSSIASPIIITVGHAILGASFVGIIVFGITRWQKTTSNNRESTNPNTNTQEQVPNGIFSPDDNDQTNN